MSKYSLWLIIYYKCLWVKTIEWIMPETMLIKIVDWLKSILIYTPFNKIKFTNFKHSIDRFSHWKIYRSSCEYHKMYIDQDKRLFKVCLEDHIKGDINHFTILNHYWFNNHNFFKCSIIYNCSSINMSSLKCLLWSSFFWRSLSYMEEF